MFNATNCRRCIDCERMVSPKGHCFRCYGCVEGTPIKKDFAFNKVKPPLSAPIWCPNRVENRIEQEIVRLCLNAIEEEPEYPTDMPDELWDKLNGNRRNTDLALKNTVRLTKQFITERLKSKLKL